MDKIWLHNYPKNIPENIDKNSYSSIVDLINDAEKKFKNNIAFTNLNTDISYNSIASYSNKFASYLQNNLHLTKGNKIGIMLPNLHTFPVCFFGALKCGLTVVNINPLYKYREIESVLIDSKLDTIVVFDKFLNELEKIIDNTQIKNVIVCNASDLLSFSMKVIVNIVQLYKGEVYSINSKYHKFSKVIKCKNGFSEIKLSEDDIALLQYTGGTTGKSKAAILTHKNLLSNINQLSLWVKSHIKIGEEVIITALPLYHIFSLTVNLLYFYYIGSRNILITNPRDLKNFVRTLKKYKFTVITAVNTLFNLLLTSSTFRNINFRKLKFSIGGGMAVLKSTARNWKKTTGCEITQGYGLTETSPIVSVNKIEDKFNSTIGLPLPSTEISIRDSHGNELGIGAEGELCVRGPQVMGGYWNNIEETKNVFTSDGFFMTGDIARIDSNGFISIVDRKKDMIISSGFNVYPNEIEEYVSSHPGILECGVIGKEDKNRGESIILYAVRHDEDLSESDIIEFCKKGLTIYKIPKKVFFISELPKNNVGKILRRKLRESKLSVK